MITMSAEPTTLMGREEREGPAYPLWIERLLLLIGVAVFALFRSDVLASIDHSIAGVGDDHPIITDIDVQRHAELADFAAVFAEGRRRAAVRRDHRDPVGT